MGQDSSITLSKQDIERLISAHDGDMALRYLHSRLHGADAEAAARDLCMTSRAVAEAEEKLLRLGISLDADSGNKGGTSRVPAEPKLLPADELPTYSGKEIADCAESDERFYSVIQEAQRIMGKNLSSSDLTTLFGFYDHLGLPAEVIMMLMTYCVQRHEEKSGTGRRPTFRTIEKEAYHWANNGIVSLDDAESYIVRQRERNSMRGQTAEMLEIRGRSLTDTETRYLDSWLDMAFDPDVIREAYDRTVTNTGKMAWKYMDKILRNWHDKGVHTLSDIEAKDRPAAVRQSSRKGRAEPAEDAKAMNDNIDQLMKMLRKKEDDRS